MNVFTGLGSKSISRLNKEYGEGNWSLTGGRGYAQSGTIQKYDRTRGGNVTVPVYSKIQAAAAPDSAPAPASDSATAAPSTSQAKPYEKQPLQIPSSFISTYGGDLPSRATGLASIKKAEAAGMSIGDIKYAINAQGINLGPKAAEYLSRPSEQDKALESLRSDIASREAAFQTALQDQAKLFAQQSEMQNQRMQALQQQVIQSQVAAAERPKTVGVKAATGSAGTQMAIARRGATGAFGRGGMRISSLNV